MKGLVIKNVTILTMNENKDIMENGGLLIEDGIIKKIFNSPSEIGEYEDYEIIDGKEGILIPGLINTHCHASMVPFRGLADDCKDRLKKYLFPLENKFVDEKLVYVGAKYAIAEMLLGGTTTFCDMYYYEDYVARAAEEMGIRGVLGETVVDFIAPDSNYAYGGIDYSKSFIKKWKGHNLITPAIAPHAPYTNDRDHLIECHKLAKENKVPMIMHLAEMDFEAAETKEKYNMSPVEYMDSLGILDENFIAAHCVLVNDKDVDILHKRNVSISHNVGANSKGAKGVAPVKEYRKRNMKVGLGTDGPMSGNTLDIVTQMSLVGKIHKLFNKDRTLFPAQEILEMATLGGARVLGIEDKVGSIEEGKRADIAIFETESVNMQPIYDYYSLLVYSANPSNVDIVIVDGKLVVRNKELVDFSIKELRNDMNDSKFNIEEYSKKI